MKINFFISLFCVVHSIVNVLSNKYSVIFYYEVLFIHIDFMNKMILFKKYLTKSILFFRIKL